jgi:hypothetical protein
VVLLCELRQTSALSGPQCLISKMKGPAKEPVAPEGLPPSGGVRKVGAEGTEPRCAPPTSRFFTPETRSHSEGGGATFILVMGGVKGATAISG